ncbi:MAG TPA: hypothetical protein PKU80_05870 [Candidatus Limiplasma sp.]|nr:hypothetical protein [Candidatus Limiplasma sp.]HRX08910.1 hypothetical protein [Candidatus Limiplasma sp.]
MQRAKLTRKRWQFIGILAVAVSVVAVLVILIVSLLGAPTVTKVKAYRLPCDYSENIKPFGQYVLFYDGVSIHCMSPTGTVRWSFQIGNDAGFSAGEEYIAAWTGSTIYVIDQNGNSTYNDNLGETIQFARIGKQYVAAVVGGDTTPTLLVKDHYGAHMDMESDAYQYLMLLDVGFYGKNGEYMWTLALDIYGTASNTVLNTYEVGKMNTGAVSLGEALPYDILFENSILHVITTRKMLAFNYRGTEDTTKSVLVYGWKPLGWEVPARGDALILFAPTSQTDSSYDIRELRLLQGDDDHQYSLPDICIGATLWNKNIYALSGDTLYRAAVGDNRFTDYDLPLAADATHFMGTLSGGNILVASGKEVYVLTLPSAAR